MVVSLPDHGVDYKLWFLLLPCITGEDQATYCQPQKKIYIQNPQCTFCYMITAFTPLHSQNIVRWTTVSQDFLYYESLLMNLGYESHFFRLLHWKRSLNSSLRTAALSFLSFNPGEVHSQPVPAQVSFLWPCPAPYNLRCLGQWVQIPFCGSWSSSSLLLLSIHSHKCPVCQIWEALCFLDFIPTLECILFTMSFSSLLLFEYECVSANCSCDKGMIVSW